MKREVRRGIAILTAAIVLASMVSLPLMQIESVEAKRPAPVFTTDELAFMANIDDDYAWWVTEQLVMGGRVVQGTEKAYQTALWIKEQMIDVCGLAPENVWLEAFPTVSYDLDEEISDPNVGYTSLEIFLGGTWESIPAAQAYEGDGTGLDGVTAEVIDLGYGKLEDFERAGDEAIEGKIVLFTRTDILFYCTPVLHMAAHRGAIGAITHFPVVPDHALKIDVSDEILPMVYISNDDAAKIRTALSDGPLTAKLVIDNKWDGEPLSTGHNVIGMIPGVIYPDQYVYLGAHYDHWFTSAADDNAGIGSLLAIAKAIIDAGIEPKRSIVFCAFDAEEMGGWADTWYDWTIGSFSHIVRTLTGEVLNPELPGKIAAMFNMDVIGADGTIVYIETTPDLTRFIRNVARDSGLASLAPTYVYWPPSSYDDWPFYMAGVPVTQIAFWGPTYDNLYHTTEDTMDKLNPEYIHANIVFNGLATIRMAQAVVLPYNLDENIEAIEEDLDTLMMRDPEAMSRVDLSGLMTSLDAYRMQVERIEAMLSERSLKGIDVDLLNRRMMESAVALNPVMFDWDFTAWIPGWTGVTVFDNPSNDLYWMKGAIKALEMGDGRTAMRCIEHVAAMQWGVYVDYEAYMSVLGTIYYVQPDHLLWGEGFLPPLTDLHNEFMSIREKVSVGDCDFSAEVASISGKIDELYTNMQPLADELAAALLEAANILSTV